MGRIASTKTPPRRAGGFTLQEMLVSLAVTSALASGGVGLWNVVRDNAQTAAANELVTHLALARSEAIKRGVNVKLCPSRDGRNCLAAGADYTFWQHGWLVYADLDDNERPEAAEIVRRHPGMPRELVVRTSRFRRAVTYHPIGTSGGSTITFALCDARGGKHARYVTVSNSGRARVSRTTESDVRCR